MKYSRWMAAAALCCTGVVDAKKQAMVFFGDSRSDTGNYPDFNDQGAFANLVKFGFCNGALWPEQLAAFRNVTLDPSREGGTNYAFSSARSAPSTPLFTQPLARVVSSGPFVPIPIANGTIFIPSVQEQVNDFLTNRRDISKKSPVFLYAGQNDAFIFPLPSGVAVGNQQLVGIQALHKAGYRSQVYLAQEFGSNSFFAPINGAAFNSFFDALTQTVISGVKQNSLGTLIIDGKSFNTDVFSNTAQYGFLPFTQAQLFAPGGGAMTTLTGPNNTPFWWDGFHYSEHYQQLFAEYVYAILAAPDCWAELSEQPFSLMRGQNAVLRQELYPITSLCEGELYPFISGMYSPQETAPFEGESPATQGWNGTLGFAYRCMPHWTVGIAGSYNEDSFSDSHYRGKCSFDLSTWIVSVLSGLQINRGYFNTILNVGFMKFEDIDRHVAYGPVHWKAQGNTHGIQYDALCEGGYFFFRNEDCQFGPFATVEYQHDHIHGYHEHGASYNNLHYKTQNNQSLVTGLGLDFLFWSPWKTACAPGFTMNLFLAANADWLRGNRHVSIRQPSVQQQYGEKPSWGRWGVYNDDTTFFGSGGINFSNAFKNGLICSVGYRGDWGQSNMQEHFVTANLSFPLGRSKKQKAENTLAPQ